MSDELPIAPGGIQLRLESLRRSDHLRTTREIDNAAVRDFAAMVLFVLDNLSVEDQRRVLSWAFHRAGSR